MYIKHGDDKERVRKLSLIRKEINKKSFFITLKESKRYKELYCSKEAFISLIITLIICGFVTTLYIYNTEILIDNLPALILAILGGFISLIAFSLSALALIISSISKDNIVNILKLDQSNNLEEKSKILLNKVITILYRFYFSAGFNVISVIVLVFVYLFLLLPFTFPTIINFILGIIVVYIIVFSLLFTLTLFSSCIKLPFTF